MPRSSEIRLARALVALGARAPSGFNRQPWACRLRGDSLEVFERADSRPIYFDADGRYTAVDLGGFVHHAVAGAPSAGGEAEILEFRAERPLAVTVAFRRTGRESAADLPLRRTDRGMYQRRDLQSEVLPRILEAGKDVRVGVSAVSGAHAVASAAADLSLFEAVALRCPKIRREIVAGIAPSAGATTGIPLGALSLPGPLRAAFAFALKFPDNRGVWAGAATAQRRIAHRRIASSSALLALSLRGEPDLASYLQLGVSLSRLWLAVAGEGLVACPVSSFGYVRYCPAACDRAVCRRAPPDDWWRTYFAARPDLILRVGLPTTPAPASPRRPIDAVLVGTVESSAD